MRSADWQGVIQSELSIMNEMQILQLVIVGLIIIGFIVTLIERRKTSWKKTSGTVTSVSIEKVGSGTGVTGKFEYWFDPLIEYKYEISGAKFEGKSVPISKECTINKEEVNKLVNDKYLKGNTVTVFYHPTMLAVSSLNREYSLNGIYIIVIAIIIQVAIWLITYL